MARYSVDIQKYYGTEFWTNRYMVEAASLTAADAIGAAITELEKAVTNNRITFDKRRTSSIVEGDEEYVITSLATPGEGTDATPLYPLFNVVRVDFSPGSGRPSRKFLRGVLTEGHADGMNLTSTISTFVATEYAVPLRDLAGFVDVDGQTFLSATVYNQISMRQLRRGSRRRTTPVI